MPRINRAERGLGAERAAKILGGARREGSGWKCRCPAHDDRTASLHLSDREDGGLLAHCFAGCTQERVIEAMRARGVDVAPPTEFPRRASGSAGRREEDGWTLIMPVPDDAPPPPRWGSVCNILLSQCRRQTALLRGSPRASQRQRSARGFVLGHFGELQTVAPNGAPNRPPRPGHSMGLSCWQHVRTLRCSSRKEKRRLMRHA